ncbi:MAG TPA: transcription-repair coupling factor, partial [bacterium]|nr:transcription-repair coupling factor [bacterium]
YRLEFFDELLTSIRTFDVVSQRSINEIDNIKLLLSLTNLKNDFFIFQEYLDVSDVVVIYEPIICQKKNYDLTITDNSQNFAIDFDSVFANFLRFDLMLLPDEKYKNKFLPPIDSNIIFPADSNIISILKRAANSNKKIIFTVNYETQLNRLKSILDNNKFYYQIIDLKNEFKIADNCKFYLTCANFIEPFEFIDKELAIIPETSITSKKHIKNKSSLIEKESVPFESFTELNENDYVVHIDYGIGIYRKIERLEIDGKTTDFLMIQYAGDGKLYLPVAQLHKIQKYIGVGDDDAPPSLYSLDGNAWNKVKLKAKKEIWKTAKELLELFARRAITKGIRFLEDTPWQLEFEEAFSWEETPDQLRAIEEIKSDMESDKNMDRLLCGDVGYGKTEVAARAIFKCLMSNYQAAILCPTTILAQQHYNTFKDRLAGYPFKVEMLSRFKTPKEQKEIIKKLKGGEVDVIIGTHRLLQADVKFKNLGLLVIDEEQRFGVRHKEKIKQLKYSVSVLTMTATPIPRTLHISLLGIRDISIIQTPPKGRIPVKVIVSEINDKIIKEAIEFELARGGQVFFMHNRIEDLEKIKLKINALIPYCKIAILHGQLNPEEIENRMLDFINKKYDLLLSTTIIENGIDIPNVNTLIVSDSDRYGLSQLYQIKGRIDRTDIQAYAYFLHKGQNLLSSDSKKRLAVLSRYTELGAGFKIAMSDLSIRGAGNIIGTEQHGLIIEIGYELYCKLLTETIRRLLMDNQISYEEIEIDEPQINIQIQDSAYIPDEYIEDSKTKIEIYKKLSRCLNYEDYYSLIKELFDRFGKPPMPVNNLLAIVELKIIAYQNNISEISFKQNKVKIKTSNIELLQKIKFDRDTHSDEGTPNIFYFKILDNYTLDEKIDFLKSKLKKIKMTPLNSQINS